MVFSLFDLPFGLFKQFKAVFGVEQRISAVFSTARDEIKQLISYFISSLTVEKTAGFLYSTPEMAEECLKRQNWQYLKMKTDVRKPRGI